MVWPEVELVVKEKRHELILSGRQISNKIEQTGLDLTIFQLTNLNFLDIHETTLTSLPAEIAQLTNLQTLVLHSNKLNEVTPKVSELDKLKVLDLSRNSLKQIPEEFAKLSNLSTLNLSSNALEQFPPLKNKKLAILDVSNNKLTEFPEICNSEIGLHELMLSNNQIKTIPAAINTLSTLKTFDVSHNEIKIVPGELSSCPKLKDLNLKANPISDRRLLKLIDQCHTKQVLDYVKQHCAFAAKQNNNQKTKRGKNESGDDASESNDQKEYKYKIHVQNHHVSDNAFAVVVREDVKAVRPHLVACLVHDVVFTEQSFKRFIQMQTKLHDGVCDKRNAATIATHDATKLESGKLTYTALAPNELKIQPLNRATAMSGAELFSRLQVEADTLRKEKKRNVYSGIHKYLYLLEGQSKYPCLLGPNGAVISFPPITNSETSKITLDTKSIFVEVTSSTGMGVAKKVADTFLKEMVLLFGKDLVVQQVRNVDVDGNLKSVYPSRADLVFEDNVSIKIVRE